MSTEDVYALMARSQELPYGEARTVLVEDALRRAEAAGDEVLAFHVRIRLTDAYRYGGEPAKAFATFGRTLADHDRDPVRFDETHNLLWQMKAAVSSLTLFPEIPLDRAFAVLDDMERRYKTGGHSLQAVYHYRNVVARHIGDGSADEWFVKWRTAERDELSDCEGCDPTGMVRHLVEAGRHKEAFQIAAPVLSAQLRCNEQPQSIRTAMLPVYLRTGRLEKAADAHRRAYRVHRARLADLGDIADHLEFCAVTGNEARGLEILQRHIGWLDRAPSTHADMNFSAAAALVLGRVEAAGHGAATVRRPAVGDRPAADVPVPELRAELAERATALADRFDARNGTSHQGDEVRATLAAEPVVDFLPLAPHHRRPVPAPARRTDPASEPRSDAAPEPRSDAVPEPRDGSASSEDVSDLASVDDLDELLERVDRCRREEDLPGMLAAYRRFDAVAETTEPTPLQRARRIDGRGVEFAIDGNVQDAVECWEEAARLYAGLGDETGRHRVLGRLGAARVDLGDEGGLEQVIASAEHLAAHPGEAGDAQVALLRLATVQVRFERPAEALATLDRVDLDDAPEFAGELWFQRGQVLLRTGDTEAAEEALRRSLEASRASDRPETLAAPALALAGVLARREGGPDEEAFALFDEALAVLRGPSPLRAAVHTDRGLTFLAADRPADAVADLVEAIAAWTAEGMHEQAVHIRTDLANAYLRTGRHLEAAEVAEEALPGLDGESAWNCRLILAHAQKEMGEEDAAATFADLAEEAARDGRPDAAAHFLEEAAGVLSALDKDALAAARFAEAAEACEKAGDPYGLVRTRRRAAMCLLWSGDREEAVTAMETARAALAGLPPDNEPARVWETALVSFDQARLLAQVGRLPEAAAHASAAADGFTTLDETDAAEEATRLHNDIKAAIE
ncbi:tetratricopeptide repeat protein [Spirillospora sp. NPDC049024]